MTRGHRLEIARELFKFSCAHMTVFPDGTKERLHGHNYFVGVALDLPDLSFGRMVPFEPIKTATIALCRQWRERTLLARDNPYFELVRDDGGEREGEGESGQHAGGGDGDGGDGGGGESGGDGEIEFRLCGKRYVLPREDVVLLPIDNVSVEHLAAHVAELLAERLAEPLRAGGVTGLEVRVTESPGQGAVCYLPLGQATAPAGGSR